MWPRAEAIAPSSTLPWPTRYLPGCRGPHPHKRGSCHRVLHVTTLTSGTGFILQGRSRDLDFTSWSSDNVLRLVNPHQRWHYWPDAHSCGGLRMGWKSSQATGYAARGTQVLVWGFPRVSETCCVKCAPRRELVPVGKLAGRHLPWPEDLGTGVSTHGTWASSSAPSFCAWSAASISPSCAK